MTSVQFRDVSILHSQDGGDWCEYLMNTSFCPPHVDSNVHSVAVDLLKYKNPPEIEASVRESYALVLLVTTNFVRYLEENSEWLAALIGKRDKEITSVFAVLLCVEQYECLEALASHDYDSLSWTFLKLSEDGSNSNDTVVSILETVDLNASQHIKSTRPEESGESYYLSPQPSLCELFPNKIRMKCIEVAVVFREEISSEHEITIELENVSNELPTRRINPCCVAFIAPDLPHGIHSVTIKADGEEIERLQLSYGCVGFTSLELMKQYLGVQTDDQLDDQLAMKYKDSVCHDATMKKLVELAIAEQELDRNSHYPTVLHWAAANGFKELVCQLMMSSFAIEICKTKNYHGHSVVQLAGYGGHRNLMDYINDFIELSTCANACSLYIQMAAGPKVSSSDDWDKERLYEELPGCEDETDTPAVSRVNSLKSSQAPPVPYRRRLQSAPENTITSQIGQTAHEFLQMKTDEILRDGSVGCRSQNELIDIMENVKGGNFTIDQAESLFRAWKERNMSGNHAKSFKEKQSYLREFQLQHQKPLSMLQKARNKSLPKLEEQQLVESIKDISEPIVPRKNNIGPIERRKTSQTGPSVPSAVGEAGMALAFSGGVVFRASNDSGCGEDIYADEQDESDRRTRADRRKSLADQFKDGAGLRVPDSQPPAIPPRPGSAKKKMKVYTKKK